VTTSRAQARAGLADNPPVVEYTIAAAAVVLALLVRDLIRRS
jgi:hypothetical protein